MLIDKQLLIFINYIVPIITVVTSLFLGYISITKWLSEEFNHEYIFYWGISFVIIAAAFLNAFIYGVFGVGIKNSVVIHMWITMALWFQMFALSSIKSITPCNKKSLRLIMWFIFIVIITVVSTVVSDTSYTTCCVAGLMSLQYIDPPLIKIIFEALFSLVAINAVIYTAPIRNIKYTYFGLYVSSILLLTSRITSIINVSLFDSYSLSLVYTEWMLVLASLLILVSAIYKLIHERE